MDAVRLHVEKCLGAVADEVAVQSNELVTQIKSYVGISCALKVHDVGGIPRSEGKAKRVLDNR